MNSKTKFSSKRNLYPLAAIIAILLIVSIYLSYQNTIILEQNRRIQDEAEQVKVRTSSIIRHLHLADLGLRGTALVPESRSLRLSTDTARRSMIDVFNYLEPVLNRQQFSEQYLKEFKMKVDAYFQLVDSMYRLLDANRLNEFKAVLAEDRGYPLYLDYMKFRNSVFELENNIKGLSEKRYNTALRNAYLIQVFIFLITVPMVFYGAYRSLRLISISDQLRQSELERNKLLADQNTILEKLVAERTREILAQNEEISAQNEEISAHNEQLELQQREIESQRNILLQQNEALTSANTIIQQQKSIIENVNEELTKEVERQTHDLRNANTELVEHNSRLKQFSYIVSHNLRAPVARILGLSSILKSSQSVQETDDILNHITKAINDLDQVIRDINLILEIEKLNTQILDKVDLKSIVARTLEQLAPELDLTQAKVSVNLQNVSAVNFLTPYMESILYNVLSNAVKYRNPERRLEIGIKAEEENDFIRLEIQDNGLGIDLEKHDKDLFKLYKRFHTHVEGKGLGLYLVKTQLTTLGGKLKVESKLNVGTTFILYFKKHL
ncbi:MAG TPA: ATP-binding protein [Cyclobacteriaceae bacterium]|nr:ATP-binding protein [Cyclobacteriaceae bacterium]HRJ83602.1 ATP-binding protein [Cyclobacteriaceae bacterium]